MAEKSGSYQWFPRDFEADEHVKLMTMQDEGIYRRLLDHQWLHGSIPADLHQIQILLKYIHFTSLLRSWERVQICFVPLDGAPGRLINRRLERQRVARDNFIELQRLKGHLGGTKSAAAKVAGATAAATADASTRLKPDSSRKAASSCSSSSSPTTTTKETTSAGSSPADLDLLPKAPPPGRPSWVAEARELYRQIGLLSHGRIGKALSDAVKELGWDTPAGIKAAFALYCEYAPYRCRDGHVHGFHELDRPENRPPRNTDHCSPEHFVKNLAQWTALLVPVSAP